MSLDVKQAEWSTDPVCAHTGRRQLWTSAGGVTHRKTWEAGLPWRRIITPWQRAYSEKHVISGITSGLPVQWRWPRRRPTRRCRGDRTGRTVGGEVRLVGGEERKGGREKVGSLSSHLAGVTDVSQCGSTSLSWCGVPGNNTYGIREMKHHRTGAFSSETRSFFLPRDCTIQSFMN